MINNLIFIVKKKFINRFAFTLLELLITIGIISILVGLGAVSYSTSQKVSRDAKRKTDLEQIRAALEMYRTSMTSYPTPVPGGTGMPFGTEGLTGGGNTYMEKLPQDQLSDKTYWYTESSNDYIVGATLELITSGSTCGACSAVEPTACNYCLGPYGQK